MKVSGSGYMYSDVLSWLIPSPLSSPDISRIDQCTVRVDSLPHRKWREIQQQPGTGGPGNMLGCCLIFFHFRWGKLSTRTVHARAPRFQKIRAQFGDEWEMHAVHARADRQADYFREKVCEAEKAFFVLPPLLSLVLHYIESFRFPSLFWVLL